MSRSATAFPTQPRLREIASLPRERVRWYVSRIVHLSPFDPHVLSMTEPQMGWIIEQASLDQPDVARRQAAEHLDARYQDRVEQLFDETND